MARAKKKKSSIGCLFWIALILLILVVFLFNRETIQTVLDETGFIEAVQKDKENEKPKVTTITTEEKEKEQTQNNPETQQFPSEHKNLKDETAPKEDIKENKETVVEIDIDTEEDEKPIVPDVEIVKEQNVRRSKLYFVEINNSGEISFKSITRPVYYRDSPLTETIKALLVGLSAEELNMGLLSLIPENCNLISISVKNNIAYINFSESFRFNAFGAEGSIAQLKQIVYTATEFSTVNAVQVMIEGKVDEYMSSEGVYIGKPLSRLDF